MKMFEAFWYSWLFLPSVILAFQIVAASVELCTAQPQLVHILILMADIFRTRSRAQKTTWQPLSMRVIVWGNYKTRLPVWKPRYAMVAYSRMLQRIMMSHLFVILKSEMQSYVGCQQFYLNYFCQKLSKPQPNLNTRLGLIIKWLYTGHNWAAEWNHPRISKQ